jgi:hypothetical protein
MRKRQRIDLGMANKARAAAHVATPAGRSCWRKAVAAKAGHLLVGLLWWLGHCLRHAGNKD